MTIVRIKVARFESTFSMPIFARIAVKAAKMADRNAKRIDELDDDASELLFIFPISTNVPIVMRVPPITTIAVTGSPKMINEKRMVIITLDLSIGTTFETSPICMALK